MLEFNLVENGDEQTSVRSLAQKMLMKMIGMVDVSAACADYMNTGGKLTRCTRKVRRIGLSGYRKLKETSGSSTVVTQSTPLDKFLSDDRRLANPELSLWEWAKICNCNKAS